MPNARHKLFVFLAALTLGASLGSVAQAQTDLFESTVFIQCTNQETQETGSGSGAVISKKGHVLTVKHVLVGAAEKNRCFAQFDTASVAPTREIFRRKVIDGYDAAVFQFKPRRDEVFVPLDFGPLKDSMVGNDAKVSGFPGGDSISPVINSSTISSIDLESNGTFATGGRTSQGMSGGPFTFENKLIGLVNGATSDFLGNNERYDILAIAPFHNQVAEFFDGAGSKNEEIRIILERELAQTDACTELFRHEVASRYPDFGDLSPDDRTSSELTETAPYWVTITTGPAQWLNCQAGSMQKAIYFPIGLIVRPVVEIDVNGETKTVFQSEHGLSVVIDRSAVAPVTQTDGFVFAIDNAVYKLCKFNATDCEPGEEFPLSKATSKTWPFLSAFQTYLHVSDLDGLNALHESFVGFKDYQDRLAADPGLLDDPFEEDHRNPTELAEDDACAVREALLFRFHKAFDQDAQQKNSEYLKPVTFSLCSIGPDGKIRYRRIKIVTPEIAANKFVSLWAANTMKNPASNIINAVKALEQIKEQPAFFADCGQPPGKSLRHLVYSPLNRSGSGGVEINSLLEAERSILRQVHFRPFQTSETVPDRRVMKEAPLFHEIKLEVSCDENQQPLRAEVLTVYFKPVFSKPMVISVTDLNNRYADLGKYGWSAPEDRRQAVGAGVIDRICEFTTYVNWRTVLGGQLRKHPALIEGAEALGVSRTTMADHFTHLIMASVFLTDATLRTKDNRTGGCKSS